MANVLDGTPPDVREKYTQRARDLFRRHPANPILTPANMPFPVKAVCNPGAQFFEGRVLLLLRVIDMKDRSHIYVARSDDGVSNWKIEPEPLLSPDLDAGWFDAWGCEDPRVTLMQETGEYIITYVGYSEQGAGVCLASTRDFRTVKRLGMVIHPYNKDAAMFSRKIDGNYRLLHRPSSGPLELIWMSDSDDLLHWGNPVCVLDEHDQPGWYSGKVGCGPPPIELSAGWLLIFHGVQRENDTWIYRFGMVVLDKDEPSKIAFRWPEWVLEPKEPYEFNSAGQGILFPTGAILRDDQLHIYYGAGDTTVALAIADRDRMRAFYQDLQQIH